MDQVFALTFVSLDWHVVFGFFVLFFFPFGTALQLFVFGQWLRHV